MPIYETYAERKRRAEKTDQPDVYQYDTLPPFLRTQLGEILKTSIGRYYQHDDYESPPNATEAWESIEAVMDRESEPFHSFLRHRNSRDRCIDFVQTSEDVDALLSLLELAAVVLDHFEAQQSSAESRGAKQEPREALEEINYRFRSHGVGYQLDKCRIIRVDSQYVHAEIVRPALALLVDPLFTKANEDFLLAHKHFREGNHKDAVTSAQRAFESVLKGVCEKRGWEAKPGARLPELVTLCRQKGLFPNYLDAGLDTYVSMLKTGLPGVRNNAGGHGETPAAPAVPDYIAGYALHMTATNILLVAQADKKLTKT